MKPLSQIRSIKVKEEDDLLKRAGVTGLDIGRKIVKGKKTDEIAIRVFVKKKKDVAEKDRIPASIGGVKTDVIERSFVLHPRAVSLVEVERKADTGTYDPLVGGIGIGPCKAVDGFVFVGTLGCMVRDRNTSETLMLTNYHVAAEKWDPGDTICQPSRVDGGSCPANVVGSLVRSVISEHVDGAVCRITDRAFLCNITEIGTVQGKATASPDQAVRKRGRTTGLTFGTVDSVDFSANVPYDHGIVVLKNQITIEVDTSQSAQFGNGGDSGSAVVDENRNVVGLYFAGTEDGSFGVANPIDFVLDELNIDICVPKSLREAPPIGPIKPPFAEKPWFKELKDRFEKPPWFEKPPFMEPFPFHSPGTGGGLGTGGTGSLHYSGPSGGSLEERVRHLEAMLGHQHFIGQELRPDLSGGAMMNEPDAGR